MALAPSCLPYLENANTVLDFANYLRIAFDNLLNRTKSKPENLPNHTYENLSTIIEVTAKDGGSQTILSTVNNGQVHYHFTLNSTEANAAQNTARRLTKPIEERRTGAHTDVVLSMHQARNDAKSSSGDRGIIEKFSTRSVRVVFDPKSLKARVIGTEGNPFKGSFLVDVTIDTAGGTPKLYKVTAVHEALDDEEDNV